MYSLHVAWVQNYIKHFIEMNINIEQLVIKIQIIITTVQCWFFCMNCFIYFFIYTTRKEKFIYNKRIDVLRFKAKSAMVKIYNSVQILWRQTVYGYTFWKTAVYSHFRHIKNKISVHRTRVVFE